ncbi:MAG: hypothetical protein HY606_04120 [Planctomycetes bacterium]|nr:hypothetical protein [Planctomycetota bacterium]
MENSFVKGAAPRSTVKTRESNPWAVVIISSIIIPNSSLPVDVRNNNDKNTRVITTMVRLKKNISLCSRHSFQSKFLNVSPLYA